MIENLINYLEQGLSKQRAGEEVYFSFPDAELEYIIDSVDLNYKGPLYQ